MQEQRFDGSLNLNVHYHVALPDGVFTEGGARAAFHNLPRPSQGDLETIAITVEARVLTWLERHGFLAKRDGDPCERQDSRSALDACLEGSLGLGELTALAGGGIGHDDLTPTVPTKPPRRAGRSRGFDINAGVVVSASDHEGRERLLRYCARPALSLERLTRLPDGRVAYALRKPWGRQTHRVMDPTTFLARLAALVPPPRHPLVRFHGVFAPHSAWRKKVVPAARADSLRCAVGTPGAASAPPTEPAGEQPAATQDRDARGSGAAAQPTLGAKSPSRAESAVAAELARFSFGRIDWAALLKRVYDVDALACPCGGRLRFIALILEREVAQSILQSLGLPGPRVGSHKSPFTTTLPGALNNPRTFAFPIPEQRSQHASERKHQPGEHGEVAQHAPRSDVRIRLRTHWRDPSVGEVGVRTSAKTTRDPACDAAFVVSSASTGPSAGGSPKRLFDLVRLGSRPAHTRDGLLEEHQQHTHRGALPQMSRKERPIRAVYTGGCKSRGALHAARSAAVNRGARPPVPLPGKRRATAA